MKAMLKTYRQSPRKVRLVANLIKGKRVPAALNSLNFADKKAAAVIKKLLMSAVSNAKNISSIASEDLFVKEARVDKGIVLKRIMPRARGSASRINKRTSHISIVLDVKNKPQAKAEKKVKQISK